jgi:hypothetical protein
MFIEDKQILVDGASILMLHFKLQASNLAFISTSHKFLTRTLNLITNSLT